MINIKYNKKNTYSFITNKTNKKEKEENSSSQSDYIKRLYIYGYTYLLSTFLISNFNIMINIDNQSFPQIVLFDRLLY